MNKQKQRWLHRHGYKPITEEVIKEQAVQIYEHSPDYARMWEIESKEKYSHYKRYGKTIMPYTPEYLDKANVKELKRYNRRNYIEFVLLRTWPFKQLHRRWCRMQLGIGFWK